MNTAMITIKTDPKIKREAQDVARFLGFPLSTIVNAYLREVVRDRRISFSMDGEPEIMSKKLENMIANAERDIKAGHNISPGFRTSKEIDSYLRAR